MKYHLLTFGCQMNTNDSERIAAVLEGAGYVAAEGEREADVVVLNSCSVRQTAEDRIFGKVRELAKLRKERPNLVIAVTGCMAGRDHNGKLRSKLPGADFFFPIAELPKLPEMLKLNISPDKTIVPELVEGLPIRRASRPSTPPDSCRGPLRQYNTSEYLAVTPKRTTPWFHAYVTISTGCSNFCSYCVVPFARGLQQNRPMRDVLEEVHAAVNGGAKAITLLGQNVNTYHPPDVKAKLRHSPFQSGLAALLWEVNQIPGVERIHFTAPNPQDMNDEIITALTLPSHVNYLHLPVQSGSDRILKKMNRRYTAAQYLDIVTRLRKAKPTITLGTDIIVGFPGETDEDFAATLDLYQQADFDISYHAMYSPRTGTLAHRLWKDNVPREEKKLRWNALQKLMEETTLRKNQQYVGRTVDVLVERHTNCHPERSRSQRGEVSAKGGSSSGGERSRRTQLNARSLGRLGMTNGGRCFGTSPEMKLVEFPSDASLVGQIVPIRITEASTWFLRGVRT